MASPVLRDKASVQISGGSTAKKITLPSTVQPGDLIILHWAAGGPVDSAPVGWGTIPVGTDTGVSSRLFYKFAVTGDASSQVTIPSTGVAKVAIGAMVWANADSVTPIAVTGGILETASSSTHVSASVTSPSLGPVIQLLTLKDTATASTSRAIASGYTLVYDQAVSGSAAPIAAAWVSNADIAAGAVPTVTWNVDQPSANAHMITIVLAPRSANVAIRATSDVTVPAGATFVGGTTLFGTTGDDDPNTYTLLSNLATAEATEVKFPSDLSSPLKSVGGRMILDGSSSVTMVPEIVQGTTVLATLATQTITGIGEQSWSVNLTAGQQAAQTILTDIRLRQTWSGS